MQGTNPTVSIAMPVRNGQRFIREALESLAAQSFADFEVIICDNASTDKTESICREFTSRDERFRYYRNPRDIGPAQNYNLGFEMSRGQYFRWHAYDDLCMPTYLERCVAALESDPSIVVAYPKTAVVDEQGQTIENYEFKPATDSNSLCRRFAELVLVNHRRHRAVEIFGLMRASALRRTPLQGSYARGDSVLLVRLALLGRFVELPERLFLSRSHPTQSMQTLPKHLGRRSSRLIKWVGTGPLPPSEWWDGALAGRVTFPEWNLLKEYWTSPAMISLHPAERAFCYLTLIRWAISNAPKLARDLLFAFEWLITPRLDKPTSKSDVQPI